jgi:hypothetical protein
METVTSRPFYLLTATALTVEFQTDPLLRFNIFAIFARTRLDFNEDATG